MRFGVAASGERPGELLRLVAVVADAEPDVEPVGVVAEVEEDVPHRQRVLAAGHGDEHPVAGGEHLELVDGLLRLVAAELGEVLRDRSWSCGAAGR